MYECVCMFEASVQPAVFKYTVSLIAVAHSQSHILWEFGNIWLKKEYY